MQIDLSQFRASFFVEADEHLQHMEAALLQLESSPSDNELLNTVFRAAHSIKGASTTFGIDEVGKFTHVLETLLDRLRDGQLIATAELIELLLSSVDVMDGLLSNAKDGEPMPDNLQEVFEALREANTSDGVDGGSENSAATPEADQQGRRTFEVTIQPCRAFFGFGQDPLLLLREFDSMGEILSLQLDDSKLPSFGEIEPEESYLNWTIEIETDASDEEMENVFLFFDDDSKYEIKKLASEPAKDAASPIESAEPVEATAPSNDAEQSAAPAKAPAAKPASASKSSGGGDLETVRVDRSRLDELINQIGELVIGSSMVEQEVAAFTSGHTLESLASLGKIVRDLQEMSLSLRMVPLAVTFQKMNRVIRDTSKKVGKKISFTTDGGDTELDKTVVDQISDPLVHMVRNAVDHGIELSEDRVKAGKSEKGNVKLCAYQQGGNVYIELHDDGRGLNREVILKKAVDRGLVSADANPTDSEICNLIFQPGFSTAASVTDISGRGVGMDVVRRNVEALQGSVSIRSEEGKGSTLTVRLPLTLAILDGLLIRVSSDVFVIPLLSVVESMCLQPNDIKQVVGVGEVIQLRGEVVPLVRLHRVLNTDCASNALDLVVIVEDQGRRVALQVDELLGQQQVVIKNLETNFRKVPGVAGATILGDGCVALILDVYGVSRMGTADHGRTDFERAPLDASLPADEETDSTAETKTEDENLSGAAPMATQSGEQE